MNNHSPTGMTSKKIGPQVEGVHKNQDDVRGEAAKGWGSAGVESTSRKPTSAGGLPGQTSSGDK